MRAVCGASSACVLCVEPVQHACCVWSQFSMRAVCGASSACVLCVDVQSGGCQAMGQGVVPPPACPHMYV